MPENHTPIALDLDASMDLPIGTEIVDAEGYWRGRTYVKTGRLTWAHFSARPNTEEICQAVEERRNNLSPGNLHTPVHVYEPDTPMTGVPKPDPSQAVASAPPAAEPTHAVRQAADALGDYIPVAFARTPAARAALASALDIETIQRLLTEHGRQGAGDCASCGPLPCGSSFSAHQAQHIRTAILGDDQ